MYTQTVQKMLTTEIRINELEALLKPKIVEIEFEGTDYIGKVSIKGVIYTCRNAFRLGYRIYRFDGTEFALNGC